MNNSIGILGGTYSEDLPTGGKLNVTLKSWSIEYYFPGPDLRYNGTFVHIHDKDIDSYIAAWKSNFAKYLQLKKIVPQGGDSNYPGDNGMSIRFGFFEGVCLTSYHLIISTQEQLDAIVNDYEGAKNKASLIQRLLRGEINSATSTICETPAKRSLSEVNANELYIKGCDCYKSRDFTQATNYFKQAIASGSIKALNELAQCYHNGEGVDVDNCKAFELYEKSAYAGDKEGQNALGTFYFQGIGTEKDHIKALHWTQQSAEQGYVIAQNNLGIIMFGNGFSKESHSAHIWFEKAIEQDFPQAYKNLGTCYRFGIGVPRDLDIAKTLFIQAIEKGDTTAEDRLKEVLETIAEERI